MSAEPPSEVLFYPYRPFRVAGILLESTWIGLVLLDAFVFFRPENLNFFQCIVWLALTFLCLVPSTILHLNYLNCSRGSDVTIDSDKLLITRNGQVETMEFQEIGKIEVHYWNWPKAPWRVFDYFVLISRQQTQIVIPSHLLGYLTFAKLPLVKNKLIELNPEVVFVKRFPLIRAVRLRGLDA